jgi:hypothetical protein
MQDTGAHFGNSQMDLFEKIRHIAKQSPDGFTVRLPGLQSPRDGYAAAYEETQNGFGDEGLTRAINHAMAHEKIVGGWPQDEKYYFDSNKVFQDREEAIEFGKANKQLGIYDLAKRSTIDLEKID